MRESRKEPTSKYGFLLDRDVSKVAPLFPAKRTLTLAQSGLPEDATDPEIIRRAWDLAKIIVTGNGDDFLREISFFQKKSNRLECRELYGLVILPNGYEHQKRALDHVERRLRLEGKPIKWSDVWDRNCVVRIKRDGGAEVKLLPRCFYCEKNRIAGEK